MSLAKARPQYVKPNDTLFNETALVLWIDQ